jgi:ABC-type phosphate/phosphonate transport system ATPase subunit
MKIYIVGLAGSGKTTLARRLAGILRIPHLDLDNLLMQSLPNGKNVRRFYEDAELEITEYCKQESWIIEGVYIIDRLYAWSDVTIYLHPSVWRCLYRQWCRLKTDKAQQELYGWFSNIQMAFNTLGRELGLIGVLVYKNKRGVKYSRIREWLDGDKLVELHSAAEVDSFIQRLD